VNSAPSAALAAPAQPSANAGVTAGAPAQSPKPSLRPEPESMLRATASPSTSPSPRPEVPFGAPAARSAPLPPAPSAADLPNTTHGLATPTAQTSAKAPINPFLANDPNQKAKRLARALVSDMVAYHPQKRDEGLRVGTLKQLFREEIKKSYEEYVDQIGKEFAESTSHFQDALNDVLAGGKKVF
jgi:hypothetical protein